MKCHCHTPSDRIWNQHWQLNKHADHIDDYTAHKAPRMGASLTCLLSIWHPSACYPALHQPRGTAPLVPRQRNMDGWKQRNLMRSKSETHSFSVLAGASDFEGTWRCYSRYLFCRLTKPLWLYCRYAAEPQEGDIAPRCECGQTAPPQRRSRVHLLGTQQKIRSFSATVGQRRCM